MAQRHTYRLFGLSVDSTFELTGMRPAAPVAHADVVLRTGVVPDGLPNARLSTKDCDIDTGVLLMRIPGVAKYLVRAGREIVVEAAAGADASSLELFLLGSAVGALCQQRGLLPLHASAVDIGGACVAFTGQSGAGKSTMAAVLAEHGYPVVCDDVCVIAAPAEGPVLVTPADPRVKLWGDGLTSMRIEATALRAVRSNMDKYHVPVTGPVSLRPLPLAAVYVLAEQGDERAIEPLHGFEAIMAIAENTYRREFIDPLGLARDHFARCGSVARAARVRRLIRPRSFDGVARTVADLAADWGQWAMDGSEARGMHGEPADPVRT